MFLCAKKNFNDELSTTIGVHAILMNTVYMYSFLIYATFGHRFLIDTMIAYHGSSWISYCIKHGASLAVF